MSIYLDDPAFPNCEIDIRDGLLQIIESGRAFSSKKIRASRPVSDVERIEVVSKENKSDISIALTKIFAIIVGFAALIVLGDIKFNTEKYGNKTVLSISYKDGSSVQCYTYWERWREYMSAAIAASAPSPCATSGTPASLPPSTQPTP